MQAHTLGTQWFKRATVVVFPLGNKRFVSSGSSETSVRAVVEMVVGDVRIFPGDNVQLRCTIPDEATWNFLWFKGSEQLPQSGDDLFIWRAQFRDSGTYRCQGLRGTVESQQSQPLQITVDGERINNFAYWTQVKFKT